MAGSARDADAGSTAPDWRERLGDRRAWPLVAVVGVHYLANLAHGGVHALVPVGLVAWQTAFVVLFVTVLPAGGVVGVAMGRSRPGWALAGLSLALSTLFGVYHHFLVANPDNVASVTGAFGDAFAASAVAVAIVDLAGTAVCALGYRRVTGDAR